MRWKRRRSNPVWDKKYSATEYVYGTEPNDFLRERFAEIPMGPVLCLADGEGRNSVFLAQQGYDVTAIDQSIEGIKKGQRLAADRGVSVKAICGDLADFDFGQEKWAGIVSIFCHLPSPFRQSVHAKAVKGLKPGGVFLLEAYRPEQLQNDTGGPPIERLLIRKQDLQGELSPLHFKYLADVDREIIEGKGHRGLGAVVQAIAVKSP